MDKQLYSFPERDGGIHITSHKTYRYTTGIAPLVNCKYVGNFDGHHPRYNNNPCDVENLGTKNTDGTSTGSVNFERIYDYGVANVVSTPNYTVDRFSDIVGRLITGEITGMPLVRKISPKPTRRQTYPEHINSEYEYDRDEYQNDVMRANPDDYTTPWANEYTDGLELSGDPRNEQTIASSRIVNFDLIPSTLTKKWDKLPGAVQRFWIGVVYNDSMNNARNTVETSGVIGKHFDITERSVRNYGDFATKCLKNPGAKLSGHYNVPDITVSETPISGEWGLKWDPKPRKPWETLDPFRSYAEWGFDGPTDSADLKRRAELNNY